MIKDSNGVEIRPGDIIECPDVPLDHGERYHVAYKSGQYNDMTIRDLGNNNLYMYEINGPYYNIGHFSKHLDKLNENDLDYYFGIKAEQLLANRADIKITEIKDLK